MTPSAIGGARRGATLLELVVTIAVLAIVASITTLAARRMPLRSTGDPSALVADSLPGIVDRAAAMRIDTSMRNAPISATIGIDGTVVADSQFHIDRLTGLPRHDP